MNARVSVVVPAYNNADFIEETVASILGQTFTDFELVIADHSSTDGTWERLQRFADDPRVRLLTTPAGGGAPANWARVSAEATGDYLKLVCGDDVIYPTCLEQEVSAMDADEETVLVACQRDLIDAHGGTVVRARGLAGLRGSVSGRVAARRTVRVGANIFGEPGCVLFRRAAFESAGGWDASEPFVIDQHSYCNVLMRGNFHAVPTPLAGFRLSAAQWSVSLARQQSDQVIGFHHRLSTANPGLLSRADLARGDLMARVTAYKRRLAYVWVGRRMHAPVPPRAEER